MENDKNEDDSPRTIPPISSTMNNFSKSGVRSFEPIDEIKTSVYETDTHSTNQPAVDGSSTPDSKGINSTSNSNSNSGSKFATLDDHQKRPTDNQVKPNDPLTTSGDHFKSVVHEKGLTCPTNSSNPPYRLADGVSTSSSGNNTTSSGDAVTLKAASPPSIADALPTMAATALASARITPNIQPVMNKRIPHLHKLEKKQSSGDLLSRLKTRKILGVGETDDGDVHRSKLSQILGHSDQLYIRLPYGLRLWQLILAIMFSVIGSWALLFPSHLFHTTLDTPGTDLVALPMRLYGGAVLCLSVMFWVAIRSQDRDTIRTTLLISILYFSIQFLVTGWHFLMAMALPGNGLSLMCSRAAFGTLSWLYQNLLTKRRWNGATIMQSQKSKDS